MFQTYGGNQMMYTLNVIDVFKTLNSEDVTDVVQFQVKNYTRMGTRNDLNNKSPMPVSVLSQCFSIAFLFIR